MNRLFKHLAFNNSPKMKQLDTMLSLLVKKYNTNLWKNWATTLRSDTNTTNVDDRLDFVQDILITHLEQKEKENHLTFLFEKTSPTMQDVQLAQKLVESLSKDNICEYRETSNELIIKSYMKNIQEIYKGTQNQKTSTKTAPFSLPNVIGLNEAYYTSTGFRYLQSKL